MATRWTFGLTHRGQTKMIYNHYDSYPEDLGRRFVDWIKERNDDELKQAFNNIKLGRCDNYGIEKFIATWEKPQTWDRVTQDEIDEGYAIEYSYNYNIDTHRLETTGEDHCWLQDLEDEINQVETFIFKDDEDTYRIIKWNVHEFENAYIQATREVEDGKIDRNKFYDRIHETTEGRVKMEIPMITYHNDLDWGAN